MRKITRRRKSKKQDKIGAIKQFDVDTAVSYNLSALTPTQNH